MTVHELPGPRVAVAYHSGFGHTATLAAAVATRVIHLLYTRPAP